MENTTTSITTHALYCREENSSKVLEHLLAGFNAFSTSPAVYNARGRLSIIGIVLMN